MNNPFEDIYERLGNIEDLLLKIYDKINGGEGSVTSKKGIPIDSINISRRLYLILTDHYNSTIIGKVETVEDLIKIDRVLFLRLKGAGKKALTEFEEIQDSFKHLT